MASSTRILIRWEHPTTPASIAIRNGQLTLRQGKQDRIITALEGLGLTAQWFSRSSRPTEAGTVDIGGNGRGLAGLVRRVAA